MVDLFGGAIVITIPSQWRDVSQVRQVPDNQEVYQDCTEESGGVIVVEILQYQDDAHDGAFFFHDLGEANGIITTNTNNELQEQSIIHSNRVVNLLGYACEEGNKEQIFPELTLPPCTTLQSQVCACLVNGSQQVVKEKSRNCANNSGNDNNNDDDNAAAAAQWIDIEMCALRLKDIETDILITLSVPRKENGGRANSSPVSGTTAEGRADMFKQILASFNIRDYSLFG